MDSSASLWAKSTDMHTIILNYVYSLYFKPFRHYAHLAAIGYWGKPDPYLGAVTPDFISCGTNGDVQIIDVKSFYREDKKEFDVSCKVVAENLEKVYNKYNAVTPFDIIPYFKTHKVKINPETIEVVFIVPHNIFDKCLPFIQTKMSENLVIWTFDSTSDPPCFRKVLGTHNHNALEESVQELVLTPYPEMLVRYFRNSSIKDIKRCFSMYLLHSCLQDQIIDFAFDEIDDIMINSRPPLLNHLSKKEREDFWRRCLRFLVDVAKVVTPSRKGPNYYTWGTSILRSPYYRERTLQKIKQNLGGKKHE
jgi:hypothetical protein